MKKACIVISKYLQNNTIFNKNSKLNRDDSFSNFIELKKEFLKHDYDLSTNDLNTIDESDIVIYFDMPNILPKQKDINKSYLIMAESILIRPDNYIMEKHEYFNKIFTWDDNLVDNIKYFKLNFSHLFPEEINKNISKKEKLCTLIAGNKKIDHPLELYSKRIEAIRWFEKNYPEEFDLYGIGWDKYVFSGIKLIRALNKFPALSKFFLKATAQTYPSYKGLVKKKVAVMEKYRFSICYENAKNIPGYITEKIFDSFFAGCVPIYWGANNILDYIPKNCFIDKRDFSTYEELYKYIKNMSDEEYKIYLTNIEKYLQSDKSKAFKSKYYGQSIVDIILNRERK